MNEKLKIKKQIAKTKQSKANSGYAILFTVVIISIIMAFATGMSNSSVKQLILSSTAADSQLAFYQADTAGECALYIVNVLAASSSGTLPGLTQVKCGGVNLNMTPNGSIFTFKQYPAPINDPCFTISVDEFIPSQNTVEARGYNICDPSSSRRLERAIQIDF